MKIYNKLIILTLTSFFINNSYGQFKSASVNGTSVVSVNQSGYNLDWPKRFTAPLSSDGTAFRITEQGKTKILFTGEIDKGIGDFSSFNPIKTGAQYVIKVSDGNLKTTESYPFSIAKFWLEGTLMQSALDFMIDDRSIIGTHPSAYGGSPWRDGTYYSFEVPSMVLQYLSDPEFYEHPPVQIDYYKDKAKVLSPDFKYKMEPQGQTALQTARKYYTNIDAPVGTKVPDIIQMIHWGVGYYITNPVTRDPSGGDTEGRKLHPQTLEQFAYFLYGYPYYKKYFTPEFYQAAKELATKQWDYTGLFDVITTIGSGKGRQAPGHSIMPNLLMYEVALRDGDKDADRYFDAAYKQTEWVIKYLDFKDPKTTKGQRMSEHKLMPALVYFLQHYPNKAPAKLKEKIEQWADVAISRSNNMWDFRRYDMDSNWTIPDFSETGNITGLPGIALSAASMVDDPQKKERLQEIAAAAIDDLFGRNPQNACSASHKDLGFSGLEKSWPIEFSRDVCARLELVRGTFSSICTTAMYPYNPQGKFGHPEGWVAFNSAWNVSMAYLNNYDTHLTVMNKGYNAEALSVLPNNDIFIQLETPTGFLANRRLSLTTANGGHKNITLTETPAGSHIFRGVFNTGALNIKQADSIKLSYGNALFRKSILLKNKDGKIIISKING